MLDVEEDKCRIEFLEETLEAALANNLLSNEKHQEELARYSTIINNMSARFRNTHNHWLEVEARLTREERFMLLELRSVKEDLDSANGEIKVLKSELEQREDRADELHCVMRAIMKTAHDAL